jgi:hypothetical protein
MNKWYMNKHTGQIESINFVEIIPSFPYSIIVIEFNSGARWNSTLLAEHWVEVRPIAMLFVVI